MIDQEKLQELNNIAKAMVAPGKGILAADESLPTIEKRFAKIGLSSTEDNRRAYREMLFTTEGIGEFISGVIMFDESLRQKAEDGMPFAEVLKKQGMLPGIKVDQGTEAMPASPNEKVSKGLEGLVDRLGEYVRLGAKFAKWRAVIAIGEGIPTDECILENAKRLAEYAYVCQEAGLVPIVEPEVLMDGGHDMQRCAEVTAKTLNAVYEELKNRGVSLEGTILKPNMVLPGKDSGIKPSAKQVAEATVKVLKSAVPAEVPGIAFLSGGQSEMEATENLNEMNRLGNVPWQLSFSYGRALQDSALKIWQGKEENVKQAQAKFYHRAKMNSLARLGQYDSNLENK